jgi:hypothetical protein
MNKYKTANGTIATEQELREYYGGKFDEMLANGVFIKVEEGTDLKKKVDLAPQQGQPTNVNQQQNPYMVSPSEDTSSELPSSGTDNSFFKKPYAPPVTSDISNIGIPKFEQKKVFGETKLKEKEIPTKIKGAIESVTPELINSNEEYVVPQMNYQFGDLGFKFEESGATGDWMKATAPNGKSIEISLDPFMSSKAVDESKRLKDFIKQNTAQLSGLDLIEKQYQNENKKFLNQKEIDDEIKKINLSEENLNLEIKSFIAEKNNVDKELKDLENTPQSQKSTQEYLDKLTSATQRKLDIQSKQISISEKVDRLPKSKEELNKAVGKYADMKSEQGTWLGGTLNFLLEGASSISAGAANSFIDLTLGFLPTDMLMTPEQQKSESLRISKELKIKQPTEGQSYEKWLNSLSQSEKDEIDSKIIDLSKKQVKSDILPAIREGNRVVLGDSTTTVEWSRLKEQGFWGGAYAGVIKSLPAMLPSMAGGLAGRVLTTASFYSQISDGLEQEMSSNPNFKDISENEKAAIILPIGIAGAVLEEFGIRNAIGSKGLLNNLVLKALGKSGATTTAVTFKELVQNEVESMIAKGVLTLTAAGLAEFETGAAQQIAEYGIKDIYNAAKGTKMFNNPETFTAEWVKEVVKAGAQEAVGGFIMGMPTAISSAYTKKGFLAMDDATFKIFEAAANDENIQKAFVTKLKNEYNNGDITIEQAKETLNNYRNSVGLFKSMPEGLDTEAKKESMNLLKEKRDLENQIIGKDDALVKPQKERINEINESLTKISEDAIQKQATDESVLLSEQSKMGLQEVGKGNTQLEGAATRDQETLTNDEQKRKVELEEALKEPNTQNGTVTIGDQSITIEDAQKELDAFNKPTTIEQELTKMEERFGQQISSTIEPTTDQGISVTNKSAIDDIKTKTTDQGRVKVIEAAQRVLKTLKSVLPNYDIVLHDDEGSYNAAMSSFGGSQGTRGNFFDKGDGTGRIDINLSKANSRTVAHEVAHGVMLKAFGDTPVLFKEFRDKISKVLNESSNKELMDFAAQYEGDVTYEEYLAELTGRLEQQQDKLSTTTLQKIAAAINEIVSRLTNGTFKPFEDIKDTKQIVEFFNNISQSIRQGEEISPADIKAIQEGVSLPIGSPTTINKSQAGEKLSFTKEPLPLSFVTEADKIDINKLIDEIIKKKQTVWFWMADQLGRGNYYDSVIDGEHYLDAGPSFALDPKNRDKGVLWASGLAEKTLQGQIDKADYIFFISGSPEKAKLFNRRVLDLVAERINKKSNFNKFKKALNNFNKETVELNTIKDALKDVNSFEELAKSPKRKSFLISINEIGKLKTTPAGSLKELLGSFNAFVDYNELRDGFYKENGFTQNDIMLVGKPTGLGGKAEHSTYESSVLGKVIGVPNVKINSWDIMPQELRDKYKSVIGGKEEKTKPMQTKVIAAETGVVRELQKQPKSKSQISEEVKEMDKKFPISKAQIDAFHGTPYNIDKFSTQKIGTGEGNQSFGWGLYFTDLKDIAQHYATELSKASDIVINGDNLTDYINKVGEETNNKRFTKNGNNNFNSFVDALTEIIYKDTTKSSALETIKDKIEEIDSDISLISQKIQQKDTLGLEDSEVESSQKELTGVKKLKDDYEFLYDSIKNADDYKSNSNKNVYEVSLHKGKTPDQYSFLVWDKPASSEQKNKILESFLKEKNISKETLNKLKDEGLAYLDILEAEDLFDELGINRKDGIVIYDLVSDKISGINIYDGLKKSFNSEKNASLFLLKSGIDGIKYPAESISKGVTSENAKASNYVVFDENAITIKSVSKAQKNAVDVVEKIINDARAQGFSEEAIKTFLEGKGLDPEDVKISMGKVVPTSGKITLSEQTLPGYDRMMQEVDSIMRKSQQRGASNAKVIENVMNYVKGSLVYEKATDVQREKLVRDVNKMFGVKEKSAPSVGNILNEVKDLTKITMTEKQGLIKQIRDLARGAKDAKTAIAIAYEQLSKEIKELRGQGKLTVNQAANVLRKFSKVNVLSKTSVDRFTDYMTKVFENADYASKLSDAKKLKQSISKLSKNKDKNADLRELGRQFSEIEPSMVENIEEYNEIAAKVKESIQGSTIKNVKEKGNFAEIVNIGETSSYIKDVMDAQNEKIREERIAEIQDLMGIDASKFSAEEMLELLQGDKKIESNDEESIKETAKNAFKVYASTIRNMINTGIDSFTGEEVEFTKKQKELVSSFIDMDLNLLDAKESVAAVDALTNFLQNNSTAKMEDVVSQYTGELNIRKLVKEGKVGIALRKLWSRGLARSLTEGGTTLPEVFTKIFKGARAGLYVATASGFNKIVRGNARANTKIQDITKEYIGKFFKTKPNGEKFNTAYNDAERGIVSDLMRSVIGTESQMQKEFERRKRILNQSIKELSTGTKEQQKKGKLYQKVDDNVVKGSENAKDIEKKVDKTNLEAINFWMKTNEDTFPELYEYMLNVRNTMLEKDLNYSSPDRYVKLSQEKNKRLTDDEPMPMQGRNEELLVKKEAGGLMKAEHPDDLPKGMYRDYSFDKNNVNSLHESLVDMYTGAAIRQLDAFKNSDYFDKLIPTAEDRELLTRRFALYVSNIRNSRNYGGEDLTALMKILDKVATLGVGMVLGSPSQVIKQTFPMGLNTMVNASGLLSGVMFNPAFNNFYHNSGYASANRGVESQAEISSLNKKIETATNEAELLKAIEDANKWWLRTFLVKPDVFIARVSWQTFYEQELRNLGFDTKNLDYSKEKLNEDAADYAEMMVSRQQNVSDQALSGSWFTKNTPERRMLTKVFLNMASFRMNSSSRLAADLSVLGHSSVSTAEDKAIAARSIAGYATEQVFYRIISAGLIIGLGSLALSMRDDDESEEDKKKRINSVIKGQLTGAVIDVFSPAPPVDPLVKEILSPTLGALEEATGLPLSIYGTNRQDYTNTLGAYGIPFQRAGELYDVIKLGTTGKYKDEYGKEKQISEEDQQIISTLIPFSAGTLFGVMPSEVATITRDMVKFSKKKSTSDEEAAQKIENAEEKEEAIDQKIEALDKVRTRTRNQAEADAIDKKISELKADPEEKKVIKEENAEEKRQKEELLTNPVTGEQYDNESKLKKYNPRLYNKNFGIRSQWYKEHKAEKAIEKKMNEQIMKMENKKYRYRTPVKTKNSDGSPKRLSYNKY